MATGYRSTVAICNNYSDPDRGAWSIVMSVSVCLSVLDHIFITTRPIFTNFFVYVTYGVNDIADAVAMRKDKFIKRYSLNSSVVLETCSLVVK